MSDELQAVALRDIANSLREIMFRIGAGGDSQRVCLCGHLPRNHEPIDGVAESGPCSARDVCECKAYRQRKASL